MTARIAPVPPQARPGDTVMIDGHPMVALHLLPRLRGRPPAERIRDEPVAVVLVQVGVGLGAHARSRRGIIRLRTVSPGVRRCHRQQHSTVSTVAVAIA